MRGIISYVPLLCFESYVGAFWRPDYVEKKVNKIVEGAIAAVREAHKARGSTELLGERAIREWIARDEATEIVSQLLGVDCNVNEGKKLKRVISAARAALFCKKGLATVGDGRPYINRLITEVGVLFPDGKGTASTIFAALDGHCNSLPGDVFFVSHLPGEGDDGYFALLRHIRQCNLQDISLDPVQRPGPTLPLRRIGTLRAPFVHALTQQLAKVFADIGLPMFHSERLAACTRNYLSRGAS